METTSDVVQLADELGRLPAGIVEPSDDDLLNSAKNDFASQKIMKEEGCDGITMDLSGATHGAQDSVPALRGVVSLLGSRRAAICEADTNAVMSHTLCCMLLGKPGFQQIPSPRR